MSGETFADKRELRALMKRRRLAMPPDILAELSSMAQMNLLAQAAWKDASSVAMYKAAQNEADTDMLLAEALAEGKKIFLPRVRGGERGVMDFVRCRGEHELVRGAYDIMEPLPDLPACVFNAPVKYAPDACLPANGSCISDTVADAPELFVIPGVAFDRSGYRVGFGGGYYDRFLSHPLLRAHSLFVGFAYSFQVVDSLPAESWDEPVHVLCTDAGYAEFRR